MNAVSDGASKEGHPMEYHGGLIGVLQQQLTKDIEHNSKHKKWEEPSDNNCSQRATR